MFSHITIGARDLARMGAFYDAVLAPLGLRQRDVTPDGGPPAKCWVGADGALPRFYVHLPFDGQPATPGNGCMVALLAASPEAAAEAHAAGLAAGGSDEGAPGERPQYGRGHYGAYLRDPEGNKLHVVHRGDLASGE